jgi:hypothetical protein
MLNAETPTMSKHITFSIRRTKSGKICGQISGCVMKGQEVIWLTSPFGSEAKESFPKALELARIHGIAHINIEDPHGLFPSLGFGAAQQPST